MFRISKIIFLIIVGILFLLFCSTGETTEDTQEDDTPWNTFLGSSAMDYGMGIVRDNSGNIYIMGRSDASWGSPLNPYCGSQDVFVACLSSSGNLIWNTFLGSPSIDFAWDIVLDGTGKIYLTGGCQATWGTPVHGFKGKSNVFIACLNKSGQLLWNTFAGSASGEHYGQGIHVDSSGNIYITGRSYASWGTPLSGFKGDGDGFVACFNNSGQLLWNTFFGSVSSDFSSDIKLSSSGKIYVTGGSYASWGSPVNTHSGDDDVFVACLTNTGQLLWNTFFGSSFDDWSDSVTLDSSDNIFVTGIYNYNSGNWDAFVICLSSSGQLLWQTLMGSTSYDHGKDIKLDSMGKIYVTGWSYASWGSPLNPYCGNWDVFVACLDSSGQLLWNTFFGSVGKEMAQSIQLDNSGNFYITGQSFVTFGDPINPHSGDSDIFVIKNKVSL